MEHQHYKWTPKDKWLYMLSMIPFLALIAGTIYVLSSYTILITLIWIFIYLIVNVFQAGCCVGCPYRGKYCPAFVGVYLGNFLSSIIYKNRQFDPEFFKKNAAGGEITLIIFLLYPLYWIFLSKWYFLLIYLALILTHIALFMPKQCSKCSYNEKCPGGKAYQSYCKLFHKK